VTAITAYGPQTLFAFDGDGICRYSFVGDGYCEGGPPTATGYEGPDVTFKTDPSTSADGEIDFAGAGLATGSATYFSLEGAVTSATLTVRLGHLVQFNCPSEAPMVEVPTASAMPQPLGSYEPQYASTRAGNQPWGSLHTNGSRIVDEAGNTVHLAAVNWYGAESADFVPMGLDRQPVDVIAEEIRKMGFNAVRLPWSNELVECNPIVNPGLVAANPQFYEKPAMTVFDGVVNALAKAGIMVILDNHLTDAGWCCSESDNNELWWSSQENHSEFGSGQAHWAEDWATMIERYATQPAVIGADLRNEPRGPAYWGGTTDGVPNGKVVDSSQASPNSAKACPVANSVSACDWHWAAQQEGNAIDHLRPHLLIFAEGTSYSTDLTGAYQSPILLEEPDELVYSPHVYSNSDYCNANSSSQCPLGSTWEGGGGSGSPPPCRLGPVSFPCTPFTTFKFLANWKGLGEALDSQWGFLAESGDDTARVTPVWLGEFGTSAWTGPNKLASIVPKSDQNRWFIQLVNYLSERRFGWSYWALNGTRSDSGPITLLKPPRLRTEVETYGILDRSWKIPSSANHSLLSYLQQIQQ
jgi:endoglucanase